MNLEIRRWISFASNSPGYCISASHNGQFIVVGHEYGIEIYTVSGDFILAYPSEKAEFPVVHVKNDFDFKCIYLLNRQGMLILLDVTRDGIQFALKASVLHQSRNSDVKSLSVTADGSKLALGYLSSGLAVFQKDGKYKRRHPDDGTAMDGSYWYVALNDDGSKLYAGSASIGSGLNAVVYFDTNQTTLIEMPYRYKLPIRSFVKSVLTINQSILIVAGIWDEATQTTEDRVIATSLTLGEKIWDICLNDMITACAVESSQAIVILGMGYQGQIVLLDGNTGQIIRYEQEIVLNTMVNDLVITEGGMAAAVTEDGQLVIFRYSD